MAYTKMKQGTVHLEYSGSTLEISGIGFVPNRILVSLITPNTYETRSRYLTAYNNSFGVVNGGDDEGTYSIDYSFNTNSKFTVTFGTKTKLVTTTSYGWTPGTYRYVAWREE